MWKKSPNARPAYQQPIFRYACFVPVVLKMQINRDFPLSPTILPVKQNKNNKSDWSVTYDVNPESFLSNFRGSCYMDFLVSFFD